jgi:hypothetical protein
MSPRNGTGAQPGPDRHEERFHDAIRLKRKRREGGLEEEKGVDRILKRELLQRRGECFAWQLSIRGGGLDSPRLHP